MTSIGQKTIDVVNLHNDGVPIIEISKRLDISVRSVEKRLVTYKKFKLGGNAYKYDVEPKWTTASIKKGFEKFISENGHMPSAYEIDDSPYLPSSRQIQRRYGGLVKLREELGYGSVNLNSGLHRIEKQKFTSKRGADAEDELEELLIKKFGSLFVHSEKRYGGSRKRVDFVVYAKNTTVAIDVFATDDIRTFVKNITSKLQKYKDFPNQTKLFFVVWGEHFDQDKIDKTLNRNLAIKSLPSLKIVNLETLFKYLSQLDTLQLPEGYVSI